MTPVLAVRPCRSVAPARRVAASMARWVAAWAVAWGVVACFVTQAAWAQQGNQGRDTLPPDARRGEAAVVQRNIEQFFDTQVGRLRSDDPQAVSRAGRAIADNAGGDAPPAYRDAYASVASAKLRPLFADAAGRGNLAGRVAAAVAVEGVTRQVQSPRLVELVLAVADDREPAVALWGIRASRSLIATSARGNAIGREPLIDRVVEAARRHDGQGLVAHEAFLVLRDVGGGGFQAAGEDVVVQPVYKPQVVRATLDLIEHRLARYDADGGAPQVPLAEQPATQLLASAVVFPGLDDAAKNRVRSVLRDLLEATGRAAVVATEAVAGAQDREQATLRRDQLRAAATAAAQAVASLAGPGFDNKPEVAAEAARLSELPRAASASALGERVDAVLAAVAEAYPEAAGA